MSNEGEITFLWAVPRSRSTALLRVIQNSPEVVGDHEPFTDCYYFGPDRYSQRYGDNDRPEEQCIPSAVNRRLDDLANEHHVFVKELAFQGIRYVDDELFNRARHIFLIRNPEKVYQSLSVLKPSFDERNSDSPNCPLRMNWQGNEIYP